ncbi:uncharacterized protein LOC110769068 [Prunus avium]|uniref:Uncharacterized protein LOC110769068 n=1 Tax=Prunus avium TaxID=42229 RepID=A0A6P5TNN9_PRUAV|nr:uncharacterized protein LOC110769068 [Prunus avium]
MSFAIVHYDVWGPTPISTPSGARWFVTFIDDCTHDPSNEIHLQPYKLPVRKNRGIPKIQFEVDPKAKVKYPISNHVSTHRLSAPHAMLIKPLDSLSTPSSVEEALMDPNWKQAMNDEMQAFQKNSTWELVPPKWQTNCDDPDERKALQEYLSKEFEMKDLGTLKYFLGIEVSRSQQDANWAGFQTNRRSTSGYFTFVGGNLVTWRSKKQNVVARSSAEAEYREPN